MMSQREYIPPELRKDVAEGTDALERINWLRQLKKNLATVSNPQSITTTSTVTKPKRKKR